MHDYDYIISPFCSHFIFFCRRIMKVNKTSERRTKFMDDYPELDIIVGLQVYSDNNTIDGNIPVRIRMFHKI